MIRAILFDFGGVLFTNGTKRFIQMLKLRYSADSVQIEKLINGDVGQNYRCGRISRNEFWAIFKDELGISEDSNLLEKQWIEGYQLIEGTQQLIFELSKKYKLYYLSDNVKERVDYLRNIYAFDRWFEGGLFSYELGMCKPSVQMYDLILKSASLRPHEIAYVDDKAFLLPSAEAMGFMTFLFKSPAQLRMDMVRRGLI